MGWFYAGVRVFIYSWGCAIGGRRERGCVCLVYGYLKKTKGNGLLVLFVRYVASHAAIASNARTDIRAGDEAAQFDSAMLSSKRYFASSD